MKKILFSFTFLISFYSFSQNYLEIDTNFDFNSNQLLKDINLNDSNIGEWKVYSKNLILNVNNSNLNIELPSGNTLLFQKNISFIENNTIYWEGSNAGNFVKLEEYNGELTGFLKLDNGNFYGISFIGGNNYVLFKKELSNSDCDSHLYSEFKKSNVHSKNASLTSCNNIFTYRVILAYTPEVANIYSNNQNQINNYLESIINSVNQVYIASNLNVRARLVFSYQTDSEYVSFNKNYNSFIHKFPYWSKYDDIFSYKSEYKADVTMLIISKTDNKVAGRANRNSNSAIYIHNGAASNYGVAHEIGHLFDLDHNREEFSWWKRKINGFNWALDNKKAYGFRGANYRTVMSYQNNFQTRVSFHSDYSLIFPDNNPAGDNNYAKARNFLEGHISNVIKNNDSDNLILNNKNLKSDQTSSLFAFSNINISNYVTENFSRLITRAGKSVHLKPGFQAKSGSTFRAYIEGCSTTANKTSTNSKKTKEIVLSSDKEKPDNKNNILSDEEFVKLYPNPTNGIVKISSKETIINYSVLNTINRIVATRDLNSNNFEIDIRNLLKGVYFIKLKFTNGEMITKKIIKN
ncbi:zinc-dependent metalloprotease [Polaribacter cellanae]|uniref:Zinc-dependent metalloprotease n=1 Tax=Polaribacter cellanae TaxID=2818493 RepID=A0A975CQT3_9FLAO|nr:zinc-dependent metalloprotease [Polaribacter cellanae]QTE21506.1 zinc-dependent metalloprotease [Polaribacter cellanae]